MSTNFKVGKGRIDVSTDAANWSMSHRTALEFLGAYRKVMIDYILTCNIDKLSKSKAAQNAYAAFLGASDGKRTLKELVRFSAEGSTNVTSDYDVTLCGPGLHCILSRALRVFAGVVIEAHKRADHDATIDHDDDKSTMALAMDSNFYTGPEILVKRGDERMRGVALFYQHGDTGEYNVAIPIPTSDDVLEAERASILKKLTRPNHKSIGETYKSLVEVTKELDEVLYRDRAAVDASRLFALLFRLKETSIEAYHGVSTVLVVVSGMQTNKREAVYDALSAENYRNAGLENVIDFAAHWNAYASRQTPNRTKETDKLALIQLSKYLQRVLACIDAMNRKLPQTFSVAEHIASQIDELYKARATGKADVEIDFEAYGIPNATDGQIRLGDGHPNGPNGPSGLVHEVFAYFMRKSGNRSKKGSFGRAAVSPTFFA
jgi:hypothetical protein